MVKASGWIETEARMLKVQKKNKNSHDNKQTLLQTPVQCGLQVSIIM